MFSIQTVPVLGHIGTHAWTLEGYPSAFLVPDQEDAPVFARVS